MYFISYIFLEQLLFVFIKDPRVLDAMMPYLTFSYGNPHSRTHMYGWESEEAVETARQVSLIKKKKCNSLISFNKLKNFPSIYQI